MLGEGGQTSEKRQIVPFIIILYLLITFDILTFYFVICSFFTKKNIEVTCVIILVYYLGDKHLMNVKQIVCVAKMFVITSRTCVVCPLRSV